MEICRENYGSSWQIRYVCTKKSNRLKRENISSSSGFSAPISHFFRNVFLPQGYPESVSEDYLSYQIWDSIQAFASSITGTLAAQSVLRGIGVGNEQASLLGATLTWLLKDGTGMLGRIMFAWLQGTNLDCNAKRCRLMADIMNDFAIFLEIVAPIIPGLFTIIVCFAGLCKSIVGVAGASTRAALSQHQARKNNMADIAVKDSSQETLVNVTALLFSLAITSFITGNQPLIFTLFAAFTFLHITTNYLAVTSVIMEVLNQARLCILVQEFLKTSDVLSVQDTNHQEPVIFKTSRKMSIHLGSSIKNACYDEEDFSTLRKVYASSKFLTSADLNKGSINIVLCTGSTVEDELEACFQAEVINAAVDGIISQECLEKNILLQKLAKAANKCDAENVMQISFEYTREIFPTFKKKLKAKGWTTDRALLGADEWRLDIKKDS